MGHVRREGNSKKESKRNVSHQKHCNRNKECLQWAMSRLVVTQGRIFKLEPMSVGTSKSEKQREDRRKNNNNNKLLQGL